MLRFHWPVITVLHKLGLADEQVSRIAELPVELVRRYARNLIRKNKGKINLQIVSKAISEKMAFYFCKKPANNTSNFDSRNKKIAAMFKEAHLIEKYGSGIKRIRGGSGYGLKQPLFENFSMGLE